MKTTLTPLEIPLARTRMITLELDALEVQIENKTPVVFVNLLGDPKRPHEFTLITQLGTFTVPPSGLHGRCEVCDKTLPSVCGFPMVKKAMGKPSFEWNEGRETVGDFCHAWLAKSDKAPRYFFVVSRDALSAIKALNYVWPNITFVSPGDAVRGENGQILGVKNLIP